MGGGRRLNGTRVTGLFAGDIKGEQGEMLVEELGDGLKPDIFKVPHHRSANLFENPPHLRISPKGGYPVCLRVINRHAP